MGDHNLTDNYHYTFPHIFRTHFHTFPRHISTHFPDTFYTFFSGILTAKPRRKRPNSEKSWDTFPHIFQTHFHTFSRHILHVFQWHFNGKTKTKMAKFQKVSEYISTHFTHNMTRTEYTRKIFPC